MKIPTILYAIEEVLLRILVRPILNTVERFTGFSNLECAVGTSQLYMTLTVIMAALAYSSADVSFKGDDLALVRFLILPILVLSVYYAGYLTLVTYSRLERFEAEKHNKVVNTSKIIHDPKRLGWYVGFIASVTVMCEHSELPFVIYTLSPFCGFAPILVLCGIRPYYNATEAQQTKRKIREVTTVSTIALIFFCTATHFLYRGTPQAKFLIISVSVVTYVLIYKLIRRKKYDANTQEDTGDEDAG